MKRILNIITVLTMIMIIAFPFGTSVMTVSAAGDNEEIISDQAMDIAGADTPEEQTVNSESESAEEEETAPAALTEQDAAIDEPADELPEYEEWQTEDDEYDTQSIDVIHFVIKGTDHIYVSFNSDFSVSEEDTVYSEIISDGDERKLPHGSTVRIKGISGYSIYAAFGETEKDAWDNPDPEISEESKSVSIGQDGSGYICIKVAKSKEELTEDKIINTATINDDDEGSIIYSDVSDESADRGEGQDSFPSAGQKFTGKATLKDYKLKTHNSIGYLVPVNGWLRNNTTQKNIAAVCISGPTKAMANKGATFNYIVRILEADPLSGKVRVGITFKPRSNKNNVSWGTVNNYHAGTQVLYKAMYITLHPRSGFVTLLKKQSDASRNYSAEFPTNYSLANAKYRLYTDPECTVQALDLQGNNIEFITLTDGTSQVYEVVPGSYYAREISASKGHKLDRSILQINVTSNDTASSPAVITSLEVPVFAELKLKLNKVSDEFGYRRLIGTKYEISYYDTDPESPVMNSNTLRGRWIFTARSMKNDSGIITAGIDFGTDNADGPEFFSENGIRILPVGVFTIIEKEAPKGLAVDKTQYIGKIRQNGDNAEISVNGQNRLTVVYDDGVVHDEDYKSVIIMIQKKDAETGMPAAEGADRQFSTGSLKGAVYEVVREDPDLDTDVKVGSIITDEKGYGVLEKDENGERLKPGRYYIREMKASPGYVTDNYSEKEEHNRYEDGRHVVIARANLSSDVEVYDYEVTSMEMHHETFISKTDAATGEELPGARLMVINSDGNTVDEWISGDKPHLIKALPDGTYTLREITAPYGYDIAEDVMFEMKSDIVTQKVEMKNRPLIIGTQARDEISGNNIGTRSKREVIIDKVSLSGLHPGRKYKVSGRVMNGDTGEQLMIRQYDENGLSEDSSGFTLVPVTAETEFIADAEEMTAELRFIVDSSDFEKGASSVVFEKLYRLSNVHDIEEELPIELQKHENIDDEGQTIHYDTKQNSVKPEKRSGPKTGDRSHVILFVITALASAAALISALIFRIRA